MPIFYTMKTLQFGSNTLHVPGHEVDVVASNQPVPLQPKVVDSASHLWDLLFSFEAGNFFTAAQTVPGLDGQTVMSWYSQEGVPTPGPHVLGFVPFLIDPVGGKTGMVSASNFIDFNAPGGTGSSIVTDSLPGPTVTATAHAELPEFAQTTFSAHATSHSVVITTESTHAVFDRIFVYGGAASPMGKQLTVAKGDSCQALAVYKLQTTTSSKEIGTLQFPRIPKVEWPQLLAQVLQDIVTQPHGEVYAHLTSRQLAGLDAATQKAALAALATGIDQLNQVRQVLTGLSKGSPT